MGYEWDPAKAVSNRTKHGVDFPDASTSFEDPLAMLLPGLSAEGEERFLCLGLSAEGRLLVTSFCHRGANIRIISSRPETKRERRAYEEGT